MKATNVREFFKLYPNDDACLRHLFDVRFGQGHTCPKCERSARWYPLAKDKAFACQWCGHHIHPMSGTIFQDSRTSLQTWFYVVFLFTTTRHGVSGKEIQRQTGVTYKTAYRMGQQIRKHMALVDGEDKLGGDGKVVEVDEAYVGGREKGKTFGAGTKNKTVVIGMIERGDEGRATIKVLPNARMASIHGAIEAHIAEGAEVHADMNPAYDSLAKKGFNLKRINKATQGYVGPNGETVNAVENFWRHLKCSIKGTHISVSGKHLEAYAKEFEFRFNRRMTPSRMLSELLSRFPELGEPVPSKP